MDAMALLCMLHADGPATLKTLRQAGCSSLEAVESIGEERLSRLLGAPAAAARRFAREARHLKERLGSGSLDREESAVDDGVELVREPIPAMPEPVRSPDRPWPGQDLVEQALAAWRERDLAEPELEEEVEDSSAQTDEDPPRPVRARPEFEFGAELVTAMREIVEPPAEPECGLTAGAIDGLDEERCRLLVAAGVESLGDLALADPLELSQASGLGFTQVWRLIGLARRADAPAVLLVPHKVSLAEIPREEEPSILELEWNREIKPMPPPLSPQGTQSSADVGTAEAERESAGGPFA